MMPSNIVTQNRPKEETERITTAISRDTASLLQEEPAWLKAQLCEWIPAKALVPVSGAREGLRLSMLASGIKPGDKVLCSGFAPAFVAQSILELDAEPMLVDVNPNTFNVDPFCLEYVLSKCSRNTTPLPKALIATDMFGLPCNFAALTEICHTHGIVLIEDMSQAMGAQLDGRRTGSFGRFSVAAFSVDPGDPAREDGGAVLCRSEEDAALLEEQKAREDADAHLADSASRVYVWASYVGEWLQDCEAQVEKRGNVAAMYRERFRGICRVQQVEPPAISAHTRFAIALPNPRRKEDVLNRLKSMDVECRGFLTGPGSGQGLGEWDKVMLVHARNAYDRLLSIPINHRLTPHLIHQIGDMVAQALEEANYSN